MSTWINVARYHLIQPPAISAVLPWAVLAFNFAVNLIIFGTILGGHSNGYAGALASIYLVVCVIGALIISRLLPFALTLGVTRRSFYTGTALLTLAEAAIFGLALTVLQAIERATRGWGVNMHFFRVPYLLSGPWYLTWLTSFVGLALMSVYGMWYGIVYRRWNLTGLLAFVAAQITVLLAAALIITWGHAWPAIGRFFTTLTAAGLTGVLAALTAILLAGGYTTLRRVTV